MTAQKLTASFQLRMAHAPLETASGLPGFRLGQSNPNSAPDLSTLQLAVARGPRSFQLGSANRNHPLELFDQCLLRRGEDSVFSIQWRTISAVSPINGPVNTGTTAVEIDTFVASYLWPAMNTAGLQLTIPINVAESANWFLTDYVTPCMNDSSCKSHVTAVSRSWVLLRRASRVIRSGRVCKSRHRCQLLRTVFSEPAAFLDCRTAYMADRNQRRCDWTMRCRLRPRQLRSQHDGRIGLGA